MPGKETQMTPTLQSRLDALKAIASAATPGPWEYYDGDKEHESYPVCMLADGQSPCGVFPSHPGIYVPLDAQIPNGAHIAAFNPAQVLALLESLEEALRTLKRYEFISAQDGARGCKFSEAAETMESISKRLAK